MNTIDLIELAVLDALGMLDDAESAAFDAAFKAAPPATQDRVLNEQARLANLEGLLPDVQPAADMRARVITAVREAMLADAIAKASEADDTDSPLSIRKSHGVSSVWRIGAIASAAAAIAFGVAFGHSSLRYNDLNTRFVNNLRLDRDIQAYEADALEFIFNRENVREIAFTPVDSTSGVMVMIEYLEEGSAGTLRCAYLPQSDNIEYALVELDGRNQIGRSIRQFESDGILTGQYLQDLVLENGMRLALVSVDVASGTKQIMATTTVNL